MSTDIVYSDATRLAELIRNKQVSPVEVVKAHPDRIEAVDPKVNAIVTVAGNALDAARRAEAAVMAGDELASFMASHSPSRIRSTQPGS